ncbi:MAG TPA: sorbitol-6-phosphate dehydrogenase [Armatimonadota bacterium]|nr:sorbitol-6-phosphate dehydrogenase [Armatimonadota bacterium]
MRPSRTGCQRLGGRVALVTGGAQGLGRALAERLASLAVRTVITDINAEGVRKAAAEIADSTGVPVIGEVADVTSAEDMARAIGRAVDEWGRLDILVCNAGILFAGGLTDIEIDRWRKVIDVNLVGYFVCAREAARVMVPQQSGVIIQINSKSGKKGSFRNSAYAASKFGGIGLTQSLALELAPDGIRVNSVCPGNLLDSPLWVDSLYGQYAQRWGITVEEVRAKYEQQVPMGRGCEYADVANVVEFLASDDSSYMTGQAINVTGGQQMD